jgi:hypothetical protein
MGFWSICTANAFETKSIARKKTLTMQNKSQYLTEKIKIPRKLYQKTFSSELFLGNPEKWHFLKFFQV